MDSNYAKIIRDNLLRALSQDPRGLEKRLGAQKQQDTYLFRAFGKDCILSANEIILDGSLEFGPVGVVISLYALNASNEDIRLEPFRAFKDLPNSIPYQGAFRANAELPLVAHVENIRLNREKILLRFSGHEAPAGLKGDLAFVLYPLPKIALAYIFYLADEEFPASATCLFSSNALSFLPLDGLADLAEYTTNAIIELVTA